MSLSVEYKKKVTDAMRNWRQRTKERMVASMGSRCQICGYNRCMSALEFHHLDPKEKDASFSKMRANGAGWASVIVELRKCILLCSNCHQEVHAGVTSIPETFVRFDESFVDYKKISQSTKQQI